MQSAKSELARPGIVAKKGRDEIQKLPEHSADLLDRHPRQPQYRSIVATGERRGRQQEVGLSRQRRGADLAGEAWRPPGLRVL